MILLGMSSGAKGLSALLDGVVELAVVAFDVTLALSEVTVDTLDRREVLDSLSVLLNFNLSVDVMISTTLSFTGT